MQTSPVQRFIRWFGGSEFGRVFDVFCVRWLSFSPIIWIFTRDDRSGDNNPCILTSTGRRSGLPRSTVLPVFPTGKGKLLIVGSRGGTRFDPHWAHNLRATPKASIRYRRREYTVRARQLAALAWPAASKPRVNLTRYHGVLAPNPRWRGPVTPAGRGKGVKVTSNAEVRTPAERHAAR